jgi:ubiquinone/menaquinone biosynthesis C-methylase UbiE
VNRTKVEHFDMMATAAWAVDIFRAEDQPKIARLLTAAELHPGASVLEPGCGTGRLTEILANAVGSSGRVLALDFSAKMVKACRDRIGPRENVTVFRAALEDYPVEPEAFDACVCHQVFPHFDDPAVALAICARSLKPGGRLLVVHFRNAAAVNELHRTAAPPIQHDHLPPPGDLRRLLTEVKLTVDWCTDDALGYLVRGIRPA